MKGYFVENFKFSKTIEYMLDTLVPQEIPAYKKIVPDFEFYSSRISIQKFFALVKNINKKSKLGGSVNCQRNHIYDNNNGLANHIKTLTPTQLRISILVATDGSMSIVDGNHRVDRWTREGLPCEIPSFVQVDFYKINSDQEAITLYSQIDSPKASKNAADNFVSGVRFAAASKGKVFEDTFKSYPMNTGKRMIAILKYFGAGGKDVSSISKVISEYWDSFCYLDSLLGANQNQQIQSGFILAVLRLRSVILDKDSLEFKIMTSYLQNLFNYVQYNCISGLGAKLSSIVWTAAEDANKGEDGHAENRATRYSDVLCEKFKEYKKAYIDTLSS